MDKLHDKCKQDIWQLRARNARKLYGTNRNYSMGTNGQIEDLTTYIDPVKFNYIFADTNLDAMNFWVQTKFDIKVRRLISAKQITNPYRDWETDRKSTRLNSSHITRSRMPSSA